MKCPVIYNEQTKIWTNPYQILPQKICLGEKILNKLNENDPNKIIEVNYDNGEKLTSEKLKNLVINAVQNLLNLGIKKGDVILFFNAFNSLTTPIVFACYIIGAAICPIELMLGDDDTDYVISLLNPTIILYDQIFKKRVESTIKRISVLNLKYIISFESSDDGKSVPQMICSPSVISTNDITLVDLGDPDIIVGALLLTSGTTGRPKIICLSHSQISYGVNSYWKTDCNSIIYVPTSFRWITPVILMLSPIFDDCCRVFSGQIPTPELCLDIINKYEITHFFVVVGLSIKIFQYAENEKLADHLKSLRYLSIAGEPIPRCIEKLTKYLMPKCNLFKCYGMTELAGCITTNEYVINKSLDGGYLYPGFIVKIIDNNGNSMGPNQNGQVYIKRISPYLKYLNNNKANDESFIDDWFITGDYGKFDNDNLLYIYNRYKDLIRCGKYILIPSIIEKHLELHKAVEASYVIGIPDSSKGEISVAFIKLTTNNISNNLKIYDDLKYDIKEFLIPILPSDQLPPEKIYFLEYFPYTTCGKVDKIKLKKLFMENLIR